VTRGPLRSLARPRFDEEVEHLADRALAVRGSGQRKVLLDLVAVPTTVTFFDDVSGGREIGDDAVRAAFGDAECGRDVTEPDPRVVRDGNEGARDSSESSVRHGQITIACPFLRKSNCPSIPGRPGNDAQETCVGKADVCTSLLTPVRV
jgi:hypothetical protein